VPEKLAIWWTGPALDDLRSIRDHVAAEGRPRAARRLAERIQRRVVALETHPLSGRRVPEFPASGYREVIVAPYRIVYVLTDDKIIVLRVWHGRRDLTGLER
jgi:addiction module RelE/StbE family toxin